MSQILRGIRYNMASWLKEPGDSKEDIQKIPKKTPNPGINLLRSSGHICWGKSGELSLPKKNSSQKINSICSKVLETKKENQETQINQLQLHLPGQTISWPLSCSRNGLEDYSVKSIKVYEKSVKNQWKIIRKTKMKLFQAEKRF